MSTLPPAPAPAATPRRFRWWRALVALKDALVLLLLLLLFGSLALAFVSQRRAASVPDGAALAIELDGLLVDQASSVSPQALLSGQSVLPETEAADLVRLIDRAGEDRSISMITLDLNRFLGGGLSNLADVAAALDRFRARKKRVEAWATAYTDDSYYLAAHADQIGVSPQGTVLIAGPGGSNLYFKDALDRLKVTIEVFRVGTYKSYVEPFIRNNSSPEARQAAGELAGDVWTLWKEAVQKARPRIDVQALVDRWPDVVAAADGTSQAELAKEAGLVDVVQTEPQWRAHLIELVGAADSKAKRPYPGNYKRVSLDAYAAARPAEDKSGDGVAVIEVAGNIVDGEAPAGTAGGDTISQLIRTAITRPDVKAIVVRVDSGGGSVLASEEIRLALEDARAAGLPVVASLGPVAASGGYWVATAADVILASPETVTGSIGVFGILPTFEKTLAELGVSTDGVHTTPLSGQPDLVGGLNDPARVLLQSGVEDIYRQFLGHVATARHLPVAEVEKIAEGRVWSGTRALPLKLIDRYGTLDDAIAEAAARAGLKEAPQTIRVRPPQPFLLSLLQKFGGSVAVPGSGLFHQRADAARRRAAAEIGAAMAIASGPDIQAACLSCAPFRAAPLVSPATAPAAGSWFAAFAAFAARLAPQP